MAVAFNQLLDLTIQHLLELKAAGTRLVVVEPATLQALKQPPPLRPRPLVPAVPPAPASLKETSPVAPPTEVPLGVSSTSASAGSEARQGHSYDVSLPLQDKPAPDAAEAKAQAMADLRQRALACVKCPHLAATRQQVVFGVGNIHAQLMFVGEAPGADEDAQGEPFVGAAGQLLTKIIQAMGLSRAEVYIANILKCRPDTPGQAFGNRKPTPEEIQTCLPYLQAQIDLIQPRVLVALGATAVEGLLGKTIGITRLRGHWQEYHGCPLMPTYHPAYLLHNTSRSERRKVWDDMLQVMEKLALPISDKQRRYFA